MRITEWAARTVLFAALVTGSAFAILWFCDHPGTANGPILMICALIFVPALLGTRTSPKRSGAIP